MNIKLSFEPCRKKSKNENVYSIELKLNKLV